MFAIPRANDSGDCTNEQNSPMRTSVLLFLVLVTLVRLMLPLSETHAEITTSVQHDLKIQLDTTTRTLLGVDTVSLVPGNARWVRFTLNPAARIESVRVQGRPTTYQFVKGRIEIPLSAGGDLTRIDIEMAYRCRFADRLPEQFLSGEDPSYGVAGIISAAGSLLLSGAEWYPAGPAQNETFRVTVTAPAGTIAVTAGELVELQTNRDSSRSVWRVRHPTAGLPLVAGPYRVQEKRQGPTGIYTFLYPGSEDLADRYLEAAADYVKLYERMFGPFPYPKFAVVENFFPTGYGFPSFTLLGSRVLRLPFIIRTSLGHEVAHSWWGNCVAVAAGTGNWSEGLTTYVADHYYKERESAAEAVSYRRRILQNYATLVPEEQDFPLRRFTHRHDPATRTIGYGKSAMVFHMLRMRIGDQAFWQALSNLYRDKRCGTASWSDFKSAFERTSGQALDIFFRQWLDRSGAPSLRLENVSLEQDTGGWTVTGTLLQDFPAYDLLVPVAVAFQDSEIETTVRLTGSVQDFTIRTEKRPVKVMVDPKVQLFRRLAPGEIPLNVNSLKGSRSLLAVLSDTEPAAMKSAAERLLTALGKSGTALIPESRLTNRMAQDHDLLFFGLPKKFSGLIPLDEDGMIRIDDTTPGIAAVPQTTDRTLVAVFPHALKPGGVVALFNTQNDQALIDTIRKIPHYGRYGLLVFSSGRIRQKLEWPVTRSALIHQF